MIIKFSMDGIKNMDILYTWTKTEAVKKTYTIYDLLYNIPCVHRAFSITFGCQSPFYTGSNRGILLLVCCCTGQKYNRFFLGPLAMQLNWRIN